MRIEQGTLHIFFPTVEIKTNVKIDGKKVFDELVGNYLKKT